MADLSKGDIIFGQTHQKINKLITEAFNTSTLRRGITTATQRARIQSLERKIRSLIGSKKVFNAISKAQYYELENLATERIASYKNDRVTKNKKKEGLKTKPTIIKKNLPAISEKAKKFVNVKPQSTLNTLINSLGGFIGEKKSKVTSVVPYDAKKQYDQIMEQSKKPIEPLVYKSGGKVKRKPYAMGGKVYGNSVRKPKFK